MAKYFVIGKDGQVKSVHNNEIRAWVACNKYEGEKIRNKAGLILYHWGDVIHSFELPSFNERLARLCGEGREWERESAEAAYNEWLQDIIDNTVFCPDCIFWRIEKSAGTDLVALCEIHNEHRPYFGNCFAGMKESNQIDAINDAIRDLPYESSWCRSTPQPRGQEKHAVVQLKCGCTVEIELYARAGIRMLCGYIDGEWDEFPVAKITSDPTSTLVF